MAIGNWQLAIDNNATTKTTIDETKTTIADFIEFPPDGAGVREEGWIHKAAMRCMGRATTAATSARPAVMVVLRAIADAIRKAIDSARYVPSNKIANLAYLAKEELTDNFVYPNELEMLDSGLVAALIDLAVATRKMGRFDNLASFSGIQNSFHGLFEQVRRLDTDDGIDAVADWEIIDPYRVIPEDDENPGIAFLEEENAFFKGMVRDAAYLEYKKFRAFLNERGHGHPGETH